MQHTKYNFCIREYIFNYLVSVNFETIVCYFDKQIIKIFFSLSLNSSPIVFDFIGMPKHRYCLKKGDNFGIIF